MSSRADEIGERARRYVEHLYGPEAFSKLAASSAEAAAAAADADKLVAPAESTDSAESKVGLDGAEVTILPGGKVQAQGAQSHSAAFLLERLLQVEKIHIGRRLRCVLYVFPSKNRAIKFLDDDPRDAVQRAIRAAWENQKLNLFAMTSPLWSDRIQPMFTPEGGILVPPNQRATPTPETVETLKVAHQPKKPRNAGHPTVGQRRLGLLKELQAMTVTTTDLVAYYHDPSGRDLSDWNNMSAFCNALIRTLEFYAGHPFDTMPPDSRWDENQYGRFIRHCGAWTQVNRQKTGQLVVRLYLETVVTLVQAYGAPDTWADLTRSIEWPTRSAPMEDAMQYLMALPPYPMQGVLDRLQSPESPLSKVMGRSPHPWLRISPSKIVDFGSGQGRWTEIMNRPLEREAAMKFMELMVSRLGRPEVVFYDGVDNVDDRPEGLIYDDRLARAWLLYFVEKTKTIHYYSLHTDRPPRTSFFDGDVWRSVAVPRPGPGCQFRYEYFAAACMSVLCAVAGMEGAFDGAAFTEDTVADFRAWLVLYSVSHGKCLCS